MKKLFTLILAVLLLNSCNSYLGKKLAKKSSKDIKVEKIKDECDCIEALDIIANDYLDLVGDHDKKSIRELEGTKEYESLQKKAEIIMEKRREVSDYCYERFEISHGNFDNGSECKLYNNLVEKVEIIEEKF